MTEHTPSRPPPDKSAAGSKSTRRQERLSAALRENLVRRKAGARARSKGPSDAAAPEDETNERS